MQLTYLKFKQSYDLAQGIAGGTLRKTGPDFKPQSLVKEGSSLAYAAKRFCEKNEDLIKKLQLFQTDEGHKYCLCDPNTQEPLMNISPNGTRFFRFSKSNQATYDAIMDKKMEEVIEFTESRIHICPAEKLPDPVPFELEPLNGLILDHKFWDEC